MKGRFNFKLALIVPCVCLGLLCLPLYSCMPLELNSQLIQGLENQLIRSGTWFNIEKLPESQIVSLRDILAKFGSSGPDLRPNKFSKDTFG